MTILRLLKNLLDEYDDLLSEEDLNVGERDKSIELLLYDYSTKLKELT